MKFQHYHSTTALAFLKKKHSKLSGKSNIWNSCIFLPSSKSHDSCNASFCTRLNLSKLQESDIRSGNVTSVATYTPRTELDFGTLVRFSTKMKETWIQMPPCNKVCYGLNSIGMGSPCIYHLLPTGPPEPPVHCGTNNVTYSTVKVIILNFG